MNRIKILFIFSLIILFGCNSSIVDDPATTIRFLVPELSHVKLTVENSYATVITTLVDEERQAGVYEESFDNSNLAEGIYFYNLELSNEIGNYSKSTIHFLLIK